jgi:hypothetical protein
MANPFISNGTCYLAPNIASNALFQPCGNDALGHKSCCQLGDQCLSNNACYNSLFGVTYLAGCSDRTYSDDSCPTKAGLTGEFEADFFVSMIHIRGCPADIY